MTEEGATAAGGEPVTITLDAALTLEAARGFVAQVRDLPPDAPMELRAEAVDTVSTPFALAIVSLLRSRADSAPKVKVVAPTPPFLDAFSDLGLFSDLMKMEFA